MVSISHSLTAVSALQYVAHASSLIDSLLLVGLPGDTARDRITKPRQFIGALSAICCVLLIFGHVRHFKPVVDCQSEPIQDIFPLGLCERD